MQQQVATVDSKQSKAKLTGMSFRQHCIQHYKSCVLEVLGISWYNYSDGRNAAAEHCCFHLQHAAAAMTAHIAARSNICMLCSYAASSQCLHTYTIRADLRGNAAAACAWLSRTSTAALHRTDDYSPYLRQRQGGQWQQGWQAPRWSLLVLLLLEWRYWSSC